LSRHFFEKRKLPRHFFEKKKCREICLPEHQYYFRISIMFPQKFPNFFYLRIMITVIGERNEAVGGVSLQHPPQPRQLVVD
jgi:hypothetical protein